MAMAAVTRGCVDGGCGGPAVFTPLALRCSVAASYDINVPEIHQHVTPATLFADGSTAPARTSVPAVITRTHPHTRTHSTHWVLYINLMAINMCYSTNAISQSLFTFSKSALSFHIDCLSQMLRLILSQPCLLAWSWQVRTAEAKVISRRELRLDLLHVLSFYRTDNMLPHTNTLRIPCALTYLFSSPTLMQHL